LYEKILNFYTFLCAIFGFPLMTQQSGSIPSLKIAIQLAPATVETRIFRRRIFCPKNEPLVALSIQSNYSWLSFQRLVVDYDWIKQSHSWKKRGSTWIFLGTLSLK
jgi:hypothetical protein